MSDPLDAWPPLAARLLRASLPAAERDEILADLAREFDRRAAVDPADARRWIQAQALQSAPANLRWGARRELTGFEPPSNAFRPGGPMLKTLLADARYAARRLRTRPGYALLSILTLALGIGGTAAVFGIARPLMFQRLPFAHADEVTKFWFGGSWNEAEFTFLRGQAPGYQSLAMYWPGELTLRDDAAAPLRLVPAVRASSELFDVLGARPLLGRTFRAGEDARGAEPVAVISYGLWQELGGQPSILGRRLNVDGSALTVIGVMPRAFWFPEPSARLWVTFPINAEGRSGRYSLVGHVAAGEDPAHMAPQTDRLMKMLGERFDYPSQWDKSKNGEVTPLREATFGPLRPGLVATGVAMGLILLIACVNVAAIMLGQVEGRTTELAVRSALGATRRRLVNQVVVEALLLGVLSAVVGSLFAVGAFRLLADSLALGAWGTAAQLDAWMFLAALVFAMLAALLVVIVPTISLSRGDLQAVMSRARTGGIHGRGGRLERGLVVVEVALAMLLASGAALLVRSVEKLYHLDTGVQVANRVVLDFVASGELTSVEVRQQMQALKARLEELPGVVSVAAAAKLPLRGNGNSFGIEVAGKPELAGATTFFRQVSLDYFRTMGMRITRGRDFNSGDTFNGQVPIVVNEALAKKFFPGESPLGRTVGGGFGVPEVIIGVVSDAAEGALLDGFTPARYYLAGTASWLGQHVAVVIQAKDGVGPGVIVDAARSVMGSAAPGFALRQTTTMQRILDEAIGPVRPIMTLLALLSALAVVLGAIGIYGVISHFAARRRRDWAIQIALGRTAPQVVGHVVRQGAALAAAGVVAGVIGVLGLGSLLRSFLFQVTALDPVSYLVASAVIMAIGVAAAFIPAWRAGSVDPARALREQ